jgi:hypothetical protein
MAGNAQKYPFVKGMNAFADGKIGGALDLLGKAVPASVVSVDETNTIVTIKFEIQADFPLPQVTCPLVGPEFMRFPIAAGVRGYVIPADFYMGGVSGLGGGTATPTQQPNLTTSVFFPVGNAGFTATDDQRATVIYGPNGVIFRDSKSKCVAKLTPDAFTVTIAGNEVMKLTATSVQFAAGGQFLNLGVGSNVGIGPNTVIDGVEFLPHEHTDVQAGSGNSGPVKTS